jgi:radical SAM protein with 4Fe4S-binding SPASM domain
MITACSMNEDAHDFLIQFRKRVAQDRIPLSGSMDLTHRCNLKCIHCYLDPQNRKRKKFQEEMSTERIINLLDEITHAGCLYLLITGGEPLLRRDFPQIYRHAKENGLLVTVFTNATLINDRILDLFTDLPPKAVEVSLYGATAETYEGITGVAGSYNRCVAGIKQLSARGVNLRLKTILMTANRHEFYEMEQLAKQFRVPFRFDAAIFPCFNGDPSPMMLRVTPEEAIEKEFSESDRRLEWIDFYENLKEIPITNYLYECGAGLTYFHVDSFGNLQPCLMSIKHQYSLKGGSFATGWWGEMLGIRKIKLNSDQPCYDCPKRILCGYCPPYFDLENASETTISEFLCSMGQLRYARLQTMPDRSNK